MTGSVAKPSARRRPWREKGLKGGSRPKAAAAISVRPGGHCSDGV
ncbi:hypothetical protein ACFOLD_06880 [Kocuria carniphila]